MSETSSENRGGGQRRRRSRGGRNRNQQGNRPQGSQRREGNRGGNREGGREGNRGGNREGGGRRRREAPKPPPLTWWQKLLKAIGLYKEPARPQPRSGDAPKSNIRNARSADGAESAEPRERKPRQRREREEPRESADSGDVNTKRIYLGNLSYEVSESDLEELFKGVGTVRRVEIVYNRRTHRSKGYGFVEMLNVDEAKKAVEILHDQFFMGRKLTVSGAKSQGPADAANDDDGPDDDGPDEGSGGDTPPTPEESLPPAEPQGENGTKPA